MSLQRIFNVARKLGTPVIMTDALGREPLVILPLDQFEAMAGISSDQIESMPVDLAEAPVSMPVKANKPQNLAKKVQNTMNEEVASTNVGEIEGIPLEERFYLEPLETEEGMQG